MRIQINSPAPTRHPSRGGGYSSRCAFFLPRGEEGADTRAITQRRKKEANLCCAGAAALLDPVAEPPVAEGDAASGGQEEEGVDDEDDGASRRLDVGAVDGPADIARALLLRFHQRLCVQEDRVSFLHVASCAQ